MARSSNNITTRRQRRLRMIGECHYRPVMGARKAATIGMAMLCAAGFATAGFAKAGFAAPLVPLPPQPADVPWPTQAWPEGPLPPSVQAAALDELLRVTDGARPGLGETRAVVIIARGRLVAERYMAGYTKDTPLLSWSMAKSITHALLGIAVRDGKVNVDQPMGNPRWAAGDARNAIPWRQWSNMIDGQDYHEIGVTDQSRNDAARMLYGPG